VLRHEREEAVLAFTQDRSRELRAFSRPAIEGFFNRRQPVFRPRAIALLIPRLNLPARRWPLLVHAAADTLPDDALERVTVRSQLVGPRKIREVGAQLFDERIRQPALWRFGPVERHPKSGTARATLLAEVHAVEDPAAHPPDRLR